MGVNSLPKTVTRQRRDCDLNPGPSAPECSTLTTRLYQATPCDIYAVANVVHSCIRQSIKTHVKTRTASMVRGYSPPAHTEELHITMMAIMIDGRQQDRKTSAAAALPR